MLEFDENRPVYTGLQLPCIDIKCWCVLFLALAVRKAKSAQTKTLCENNQFFQHTSPA